MRKNLNRLATLALSGMMVMSMTAPAFAATSVKFDKILHTDGHTHAPDTTFQFTVESSTEASYTIGGETYPNLKPKAGVADPIKVADVKFQPVAGELGEVDAGKGAHFTKENNLTINPAAFDRNGYYVFTLKEVPGNYEGIRYNKTEYKVVVFKGEPTTTNPEGITIVVTKPGKTEGSVEKPESIENNYGKHQPPNDNEYPKPKPDPQNPNEDPDPNPNDTTHDVIVTKKLAGVLPNQAKTFKFSVNVVPAQGKKEIYKVVAYDASKPEGQRESTNPADFKYIQNGNAVEFTGITESKGFRVYGLTKNDKVVVTEADGQTYTMTVDETSNSLIRDLDKTDLANYRTNFFVKGDDAKVQITNTKGNITPTGIVMNVAPYAMMLAVAGGLGVVFMNRKKEEE